MIAYLEGDRLDRLPGRARTESSSNDQRPAQGARHRQDLVRPLLFGCAAQAALPNARRAGARGQAAGVRARHAGPRAQVPRRRSSQCNLPNRTRASTRPRHRWTAAAASRGHPGSLPGAGPPADARAAAPPDRHAADSRISAQRQPRASRKSFPNPATNEQVIIFSSGVNLVVDGMQNFGSIDLVTDRLVIWTSDPREPLVGGEGWCSRTTCRWSCTWRATSSSARETARCTPIACTTTCGGRSAWCSMPRCSAPCPPTRAPCALRAKVLEQVGPDRFTAHDASFTSSRLAVPGYDLDTSTMTYDRRAAAGDQSADRPGRSSIRKPARRSSQHNARPKRRATRSTSGGCPVFYWPYLATDLEQPNYYVDNIQFRNDRVFGTQVFLDLNAYQLLGIKNRPEGHQLGFQHRLPEPPRPGAGHVVHVRPAEPVWHSRAGLRHVRRLGHPRRRDTTTWA